MTIQIGVQAWNDRDNQTAASVVAGLRAAADRVADTTRGDGT